nr:DUF262 domain-containing protein [uncultured Duganella sp.]
MNNRFAAPVPEVHYLPSLFRKIQSGELRIPAFQRGFVWKEKNIIELMESIFMGYPIGSLLFWKSTIGQLKEIPAEVTSFPEVDPRTGEVLFVLDGMQRMSTLYGVFHKKEDKDPKFKIAYDFLESRFYALVEENDEVREGSLLLDSLFSPRDFLTFQSQALTRENGDDIIARSIELQSVFQEYLVPTVTINDRNVADVVDIFSRVNSTGVKLDAVDFVRALTWSSQFDLTHEVQKLESISASLGFTIEGQTFVKLIAICADTETTSEQMFKMSEMLPPALHAAVERAQQLTPLALEMLSRENSISNSELLGYEGQFLIWAAAIKAKSLNLNFDYSAITQLVWQIGFGEILRGKPDHFLERILQKIYSGPWSNFVAEFRPSNQLFMTRRFLNGKALSSAVVGLFHDRLKTLKAIGCVSGDFEIDTKLNPAFKIDRKFGETRSDKIFANLVAGSGALSQEASFSDCSELFAYMQRVLGATGYADWLALNYLDVNALPTSVDDFLHLRAEKMKDHALELIGLG